MMAGKPMPESVRANAEETCKREERVVVRLKPYATFETPLRMSIRSRIPWGLSTRLTSLCCGTDDSSQREVMPSHGNKSIAIRGHHWGQER